MGKCFSKSIKEEKNEAKSNELVIYDSKYTLTDNYKQIHEEKNINALIRENQSLKDEIVILKQRINDLQEGKRKKTSNYVGETKIIQLCNELKNKDVIENFESNKKYDYCKHKRALPFDICVYLKESNINILIEVDGDQHFQDVVKWNSHYLLQQRKDVYKMKQVLKHNHSVIRVYRGDLDDKYEIIKERIIKIITKVINKIKGNKYKAIPRYIASNLRIYDSYKELMMKEEEDVNKLYEEAKG